MRSVRPCDMTVDYSPKFGRKQRTELLPDGTVQVTVHSYGVEHVYRVGSAQLSPHYTTYRDAKIGTLIGAAILVTVGALAFLFRFPSQSSGTGDDWPHVFVGSILWSMAAIIFASWPFQKIDVVLFMDRDRKRSLLSIPRKSSPSELDAFIKELVSQIPPQ